MIYYNKLKTFLYYSFFFNSDRNYLFTFLSQGLKNGGTTKELLQAIVYEYEKSKKLILVNYITETLKYMEQYGYSDSEAMKMSGIISEIEYMAIQHISKSEPHKSLMFIIEKTKNQNNFKWAVGMLFFPVVFVLFGYLIFQPELAKMTLDMLAPVNSLSTKKIEIPPYFESRYFFGTLLFFTLSFITSLFLFIEFLKRKNQKLLFKLFKIFEREFIINNFEIFLSLLKTGQSQMKAIEILSENPDIVSRIIFTKIKESMSEGNKNIYEIFGEYGIDSATISYIRSGEMNNYLIESVDMALEYNKLRYEKLVKILSKALPLIGEIIMTIALLKPLIDIIQVTTVGTLSFKI